MCVSIPYPQVQAPARAGALAPVDVFVEAGNTGLGPEKTSFFQALHIATKISRGTIEILVCVGGCVNMWVELLKFWCEC